MLRFCRRRRKLSARFSHVFCMAQTLKLLHALFCMRFTCARPICFAARHSMLQLCARETRAIVRAILRSARRRTASEKRHRARDGRRRRRWRRVRVTPMRVDGRRCSSLARRNLHVRLQSSLNGAYDQASSSSSSSSPSFARRLADQLTSKFTRSLASLSSRARHKVRFVRLGAPASARANVIRRPTVEMLPFAGAFSFASVASRLLKLEQQQQLRASARRTFDCTRLSACAVARILLSSSSPSSSLTLDADGRYTSRV